MGPYNQVLEGLVSQGSLPMEGLVPLDSLVVEELVLLGNPVVGELVPLVFGTNGRASDEAVAFIRAYGVGLPPDNRAEVIGTTWRHFGATLRYFRDTSAPL